MRFVSLGEPFGSARRPRPVLQPPASVASAPPSQSLTSPEFWLNLQKLYELRLTHEDIGDRVDKPKRGEPRSLCKGF
jgi:hypothetical protein